MGCHWTRAPPSLNKIPKVIRGSVESFEGYAMTKTKNARKEIDDADGGKSGCHSPFPNPDSDLFQAHFFDEVVSRVRSSRQEKKSPAGNRSPPSSVSPHNFLSLLGVVFCTTRGSPRFPRVRASERVTPSVHFLLPPFPLHSVPFSL